jgi:hypothetical protein
MDREIGSLRDPRFYLLFQRHRFSFADRKFTEEKAGSSRKLDHSRCHAAVLLFAVNDLFICFVFSFADEGLEFPTGIRFLAACESVTSLRSPTVLICGVAAD